MIRGQFPWEDPAYCDAMQIRHALRKDPHAIVRMALFTEWEADEIRAHLRPEERHLVYFTWLFAAAPLSVSTGATTLVDRNGHRRRAT